jgi:hypothetical protein
MWVPAGVVYIAVSLVLFAVWIGESDRTRRIDGHGVESGHSLPLTAS